ncbi:hypothetical protein [Emticicia sp. SJ17W-69]|uniref:hypothetical protein n=1 Tax=Emticicia sp. SJ17W-69 TaxID=3421657 RepID=UPI003EBF540B
MKSTFTYLIILTSCLLSCNKTTNGDGRYSFYYWKTSVSLTKNETDLLTNVRTIYVRYFDIKWDKKPIPVAKVDFTNFSFKNTSITPVIYIKNEVFTNISEKEIRDLSNRTLELLDKINTIIGIKSNKEIQIDCDWSDETKSKYFDFLKNLKEKYEHTISVTIRLHQIKYYSKTGIPPCDKGVLMFYNMGKLGNLDRNSIYNNYDASQYVKYVKNYPLFLDVALPIFRWGYVLRNRRIINLLSKIDDEELKRQIFIKQIDKQHFQFLEGMYWKGIYFQKNDEIVIEKITQKELFHAANLLSKYIKHPSNTIFFDLDSANISHFSHEEFFQVSSLFR